MPSPPSPCPDLETLAEYAEGRIDGARRTDVLRHLAQCGDCRAVVTEASQFLSQGSSTKFDDRPHRWFSSRQAVRLGAFVGLAAAVVLVIRLRAPGEAPRDDQIVQLAADLRRAAAAQATRPFEPRLTGGFDYRPTDTKRSTVVWESTPELRLASGTVVTQLAADRSDAARRLRASASLMVGDIDAAIQELEYTPRAGEAEAARLTDLSAAYYVRGWLRRDANDIGRAHALASEATKRDPILAEAWFNRAVAAQAAELPDAVPAWKQFLMLDSTSEWSDEARRQLRRLGG